MQPQYREVFGRKMVDPFLAEELVLLIQVLSKRVTQTGCPNQKHSFPRTWLPRSPHERSESEQDVPMMWRFMSSDVGLTIVRDRWTSYVLQSLWQMGITSPWTSRDAIRPWGKG